MKYLVTWEGAETRRHADDPKGFSKTFVDESCGAKHLHIGNTPLKHMVIICRC